MQSPAVVSRNLECRISDFGFLLPLLAACLTLFTGCAVGPNYHPPKPSLPANWSEVGPGGTTNRAAALARWWQTLADTNLDVLIERAVRTNYDLIAATARVRAARALRGAAISDLFPTVGANASYTEARRSQNALLFPSLLDTDTYQAGFDASWELDVFGGKRRSLQAATADLQSFEEDRRAVLVSVMAEVARNYVELRGTQQRLVITREMLKAQGETVDLTRLLFEKGLSSELDVTEARALRAATESQVPVLETAAKVSGHRLSVLLGQAPGALEAEFAPQAPIPGTPPEVPAGLPSELLRRRPDIRRGERQLAAATARIGVATAELFPKFFLTGSAGYQSLEAGTLISPASKFWSAGPSVRWRLLEYPRLRSQIRAQTALQEQALAQFNQTVLLALEEVENALVAYANEKARYLSLAESLAQSRHSLELATQLYEKGVGDFLTVLVAEGTRYQAEDAAVQSRRAATQDLIALYKALGGGWESEPKKN